MEESEVKSRQRMRDSLFNFNIRLGCNVEINITILIARYIDIFY